MKGLIISSLTGLFLASIGISYADAVRITVINDSVRSAKSSNEILMIKPANQAPRQYALPGMLKMFTADYTYPSSIEISHQGSRVACNWVNAPIGKQVISRIVLNITSDLANKRPNCLIDWQ